MAQHLIINDRRRVINTIVYLANLEWPPESENKTASPGTLAKVSPGEASAPTAQINEQEGYSDCTPK